MARNPAVRKAAKAQRRKMAVAAKRTMDGGGPAVNVREGAALPILRCLVSNELFRNGIGYVILCRGASREYQHCGFFMLDTFCLGVKDVFFRTVDRQEAEHLLSSMQRTDPTSPIAPQEARKLLHDVVAWGGNNGFPPHKDYARVESLFGDVTPAETDYTPRFGHKGEVLYIPGPNDTPAQVRQRMHIVRSRSGGRMAADTSLLAIAGALAGEFGLITDDDEC